MNFQNSFNEKRQRILNSYHIEKSIVVESEVIVKSEENEDDTLEKGGVGSGPHKTNQSKAVDKLNKELENKNILPSGSSSFQMFKNMTDEELKQKYKEYLQAKKIKNRTPEQYQLVNHFADLKFTMQNRNLIKSEDIDLLEDLNDNSNQIIKALKYIQIQKSFDILSQPLEFDLQKGLNKTDLHPEKITIHRKDGTIYQGIRWKENSTNSAKTLNGLKKENEYEGKNIDEKISNIINGNFSNKDKVHNLISLGVYDRKQLAHLVDDGYARQFLKQHDIGSDFTNVELNKDGTIKSAEAVLTSVDPIAAGKKYKPEIDINMSMEDAAEMLSDKELTAYKKKLVESIKEKYGITSDKMWLSYERNIVRLIDTGQPKSMLCYGTGGVGKTYTLEQVLNNKQVRLYQTGLDMQPEDYDAIKITGSTSKTGLWKKLYENRDKMVIFDDCDSLWDDPDCVNWLKGALDSSGDGTINYDQGNKVKLTQRSSNPDDEDDPRAPTEFQFQGKVIFISNLTSAQLVKKGAGPLVESRCMAIDLTMNLQQTMEKLGKIKDFITLRDNKGNAIPGVTQEDRNVAYDFLKEMGDKVPVSKINGRTLGNLIGTATNLRKLGQFTPESYVDEALITLLS